MEPPINNIKLSQTAKDQLTRLKRSTKIDHWNILCRWAFCRSLSETTPPSIIPIPADSNLEMTWRVFGGDMADILTLALKQRCYEDGLGIEPDTLSQQFRLHLHRGIGYLSGDPSIKKIEHLVGLVSSGVGGDNKQSYFGSSQMRMSGKYSVDGSKITIEKITSVNGVEKDLDAKTALGSSATVMKLNGSNIISGISTFTKQ